MACSRPGGADTHDLLTRREPRQRINVIMEFLGAAEAAAARPSRLVMAAESCTQLTESPAGA